MTQTHRPRAASLRILLWPFRILYRVVLMLLTLLMIGFSYAVGGVPRIQPPEKKNRLTQVDPD
jgi:hypothetical protein